MRRLLGPVLFILFAAFPGVVTAQGTRVPGGAGNAARNGPLATQPREVTVVNKSKRTVRELFVSPGVVDDWGNDRLGDGLLTPGKQFRVRLGASRECMWDVQVAYDDGSMEESRNVNLCRVRQVSFDGSAAVLVERGPERSVAIQNATVRRIDGIYISAPDAEGWGDDRLPDRLAAGQTSTVPFRGECVADIRIVFQTRAAEERRGVDLCKLGRLVITPGWTLAEDPSAEPEPPRGEQTVILNRAGRGIAELYVFPDGTERGEDRLGMAMLADGGRKQVELGRGQTCRYTVRVVFTGSNGLPELERSGLNFCRTGQVDIDGTDIREAALQ